MILTFRAWQSVLNSGLCCVLCCDYGFARYSCKRARPPSPSLQAVAQMRKQPSKQRLLLGLLYAYCAGEASSHLRMIKALQAPN